MKNRENPNSDINQTLGLDKHSDRRKRLRRWLIVSVLLAAIVGFVVIWTKKGKPNPIQFKTEQVRRGDITVIVTATGTLQPTNEVEVGSELSGIVESVEVDYNEKVKVDQVLAKLDTSKLESQIRQAKGSLKSAQARLLEAQATLKEERNDLARLERLRELSDGKVPSQQDLDTAEAASQRADAAEASASASVEEAQANLKTLETDLLKSAVRSPINGIVLTRSVEPGQTVAAAFQTPVLFTLAEDLTQMELHVNVDEADIGQVKEGQNAVFTVDAYPNRTFKAQIIQTRYGSQTVDGVVTYETVLKVDNAELSLRPGMTATADIIVMKVEDAVLVSNSALRFEMPEKTDKKNNGGLIGAILPHPPRRESKQKENTISTGSQHKVWILKDGQPVAVSVTTGATDGIYTEIADGDIETGMPLIVDIISKGSRYGPPRADR